MNLKSKAQAFVVGHRKKWAIIALMLFAAAMCYGVYRLVAYSVPLYTGDPYRAAQAGVGDEAVAIYNAGLTAYERQNYDVAKEIFTQGYSSLTDSTGTIPQSRQKLASDFQFELGNTLVKSGKVPDAIEAYKQALRHNPDNLPAKYNLELLNAQLNGGGDGNGQGDGQGGQQPQPGDPGKKPSPGGGKDPKKGI
jgi:tetratricopeptide (TPR) repeat protein